MARPFCAGPGSFPISHNVIPVKLDRAACPHRPQSHPPLKGALMQFIRRTGWPRIPGQSAKVPRWATASYVGDGGLPSRVTGLTNEGRASRRPGRAADAGPLHCRRPDAQIRQRPFLHWKADRQSMAASWPQPLSARLMNRADKRVRRSSTAGRSRISIGARREKPGSPAIGGPHFQANPPRAAS